MNYLNLKDIDAYKQSFKLSNQIWKIVMNWDKLAQWTVGKQLISSADSIPANIAEGWGRFYKKEKIQFYRYSFGSLKETQDWIEKAFVRGLIEEGTFQSLNKELEKMPKLINQLINFTNDKLKY